MNNFIFNPPDGLNNKISFPTNPASEEEARGQIQEPMNQLKDFINNSIIPQFSNVATYGYNANGHYILFDNGVQICWVNMSVSDQAISNSYGSAYIGDRTWTFPNPFLNSSISISCNQFKWGTSASWGIVAGNTSTTADLRGMDFFSRATGTNCLISATAIGRWK